MRLQNKPAVLRWQAAWLAGRIGTVPLVLAGLPAGLLVLWLGAIRPHTVQLQENLVRLQAQLHTALPLDKQQPELQSHVSLGEYQQVRLIFEQFRNRGMQVDASRYQLEKDDGKTALRLDIPLRGEYLPLMDALETLGRTLPLRIEQLSLRRAGPSESQLSATVQLRLLKESP
ncbi:hypothetical protein [Enterobacter ludwigii]|uniref:hypothetical protein n=1 Tax=Enterobacter ludwigii TaxID=299767 RepID=UPI000589158E|nr:hypothetical protein [Enterobacter ludwigii]AOT41833.1 hypothetical protein BH714_00225 [Enterobacter ludwigii]KIF84314.1 hypothetical protein QY91_00225 [Enterobacter ludwigii]QWZ70039.1 hypothetical protein I6L66_07545 [Enterobacter ludwigii]